MSQLRISLFGRFCVQCDDQLAEGFEIQKVQELFCYLLLHRDRPHPREKLADLLWSSSSSAQAKKYLRQTLWQLQSMLEQAGPAGKTVLLVESDWLQVNEAAELWVDATEFERAFARVKGRRGGEMDSAQARTIRRAVRSYQGDLLENWYQDWCIFERERLQNIYLSLLDKLMGYCEARADYDSGISYGFEILRNDPARERTHRRLMRLHYLSGDRTGALRQYQRCAVILAKELDIEPAARTKILYQQIQGDHPLAPRPASRAAASNSDYTTLSLSEIRDHFLLLCDTLIVAQQQVDHDIEALSRTRDG
jgi:DNA-binding SARP family transcriptional activator